MSEPTNPAECGRIRDLIPDYVRSELPAPQSAAVDGHVASCGDCAAELELALLLWAGRASAPIGLLERIEEAVASDRRVPTHTWWGVSAAAIAALALGIGLTSSEAPAPANDVPGFAYEAEEGEIWLSDDGLLAGAPALYELSDEALLQLLDELSTGTAGGGGA